MAADTEYSVLEHLERIQAEQSAARERDREMIRRISHIEVAVARICSNQASYYKVNRPPSPPS